MTSKKDDGDFDAISRAEAESQREGRVQPGLAPALERAVTERARALAAKAREGESGAT